jgi:hypothetical protein
MPDHQNARPEPSDDDRTREVEREDPEAPGLGAVDGADQATEVPEPQEPG